jgi:Cu+-exporting ATPase
MSTVDVVCGAPVDPSQATEEADFRGRKYYFCSANCREEFTREPLPYVERQEALQPPADMQ